MTKSDYGILLGNLKEEYTLGNWELLGVIGDIYEDMGCDEHVETIRWCMEHGSNLIFFYETPTCVEERLRSCPADSFFRNAYAKELVRALQFGLCEAQCELCEMKTYSLNDLTLEFIEIQKTIFRRSFGLHNDETVNFCIYWDPEIYALVYRLQTADKTGSFWIASKQLDQWLANRSNAWSLFKSDHCLTTDYRNLELVKIV